ncbi:MAG: hypothetical protein D6794_09880 [Deltaproteobacteria bacterium]|nr:MAG: hypothetical protein D6794_09880 [Deltaproteobacteria bacterium]
MIWLELANEQGQELYFDAWKRERSRTGAGELVSGLIGDGSYEGEVLVELRDYGCELTFVDRFLAPERLASFLERISLDRLRSALTESLNQTQPLGLGRRRSDPPEFPEESLWPMGHLGRRVA